MRTDHWQSIELRHLEALRAIAEEGSFGRAAERLGYTQSAISQQIAALERAVGQQLLERPGGPRPVSLTQAGELLLAHARGIVARLSAARADMAALSAGEAGTLRVGTFQSVGARVLPQLLQEFAAAYPHVRISLTEATDDADLLQAVERGELDLAFVMLPAENGPFEVVELLRDPYVLVVSADSPLARKKVAPSLNELAKLKLIGYRQCRSMLRVETHLQARGLEPEIAFRSDDNGTIQGLVAAGVGVALVPRLTIEPSDSRIAALDMGERLPPRLIGIAWHRDRYVSPAAQAFVAAARDLSARLPLAA